MGGFSYDRDDYGSSSSSSWGSYSSYSGSSSYSSMASSRMSASSLDDSMLPKHRIESKSKHPIVVVLDVTGSNTDIAKIVYDKMPMFYGQIEQKGYLDDFDICFMAVGDVKSDRYPLQVGNFAKGITIDTYLEKIVLEGGGGANDGESYEIAAYYLTHYMDIPDGAEPMVFFIGDEKTHGTPEKNYVEELGMDYNSDTVNVWNDLRRICDENVYMLLGKYSGCYFDGRITAHWESLLADKHVVKVGEEKAVVDLILGIISMVSEARDLDSYKVDMLDRGQTQARISSVSDSLSGLSTALVEVKGTTNVATAAPSKKSTSKGKRI